VHYCWQVRSGFKDFEQGTWQGDKFKLSYLPAAIWREWCAGQCCLGSIEHRYRGLGYSIASRFLCCRDAAIIQKNEYGPDDVHSFFGVQGCGNACCMVDSTQYFIYSLGDTLSHAVRRKLAIFL
jgi:hypothetical protein